MNTFSELLEQVRTVHETQVGELATTLATRDSEIASLKQQLAGLTKPAVAHRHGIVIWFSDDVALFAPRLKEIGINAVRGWVSVGPDAGAIGKQTFAQAAKWKAAGFATIACIHPDKAVTAAAAVEMAKRLADQMDGVSIAELGNEPDLVQYWPKGDWQNFIDTWLRPVATTLQKLCPQIPLCIPALGHQAKSPTYLSDYAAAVKDIPAQYAAIHPYSANVGDLKNKLQKHSDCLQRPLLATEWDVYRNQMEPWKKNIPTAVKLMREMTAMDFFYRLYDRDGVNGGWDDMSLFDRSGKPTAYCQPYRDALRV